MGVSDSSPRRNSFYSVIENGIPRVEKNRSRRVEKKEARNSTSPLVAEAYQTHGVPPTIAESVGRANMGLTFDWNDFEKLMDEHSKSQ